MKKGNRRFEGLFLVCLVAGMMLAYAACGDDEPSQVCDPGSTQDCSCGGGRIGVQICESTGLAWGTCENCDCTPNCAGRECGPDPECGALCGTCPVGETCNASGTCDPGTPTWDATRCSSSGGYWAALNLDGGGGGSGCWFAASTDNVACTTVCSGHGLQCKSGNWNDDSSNSICLHFFPTSYPASVNNPEGNPDSPVLITEGGSGCVYRCPLGTSIGSCPAGGTAQQCDFSGNGRTRICVCEP
jgi:hypothetical protein